MIVSPVVAQYTYDKLPSLRINCGQSLSIKDTLLMWHPSINSVRDLATCHLVSRVWKSKNYLLAKTRGSIVNDRSNLNVQTWRSRGHEGHRSLGPS